MGKLEFDSELIQLIHTGCAANKYETIAILAAEFCIAASDLIFEAMMIYEWILSGILRLPPRCALIYSLSY
jgi:hypothetical protein